MGEELITAPISEIVNAGRLAGAAMLVWQDSISIRQPFVGIETSP